MAINVGDKIPDVEVFTPGSKGPEKVRTSDLGDHPYRMSEAESDAFRD